MIQNEIVLQGVAVSIRIYDRRNGENCFSGDGERWCCMPGFRYLMTFEYDLGGSRRAGYQYYHDRLTEFQIYKAINSYLRRRRELF